jgi:hypothetical protein
MKSSKSISKISLPSPNTLSNQNKYKSEDAGFFDGQVKIALRNCGHIDPESLEEYEAREGYAAMRKISNENILPTK